MIPLAGGAVSLAAGSRRRAAAATIVGVTLALSAALLLSFGEVWSGEMAVHRIGGWRTGLGLGLALDMLGSVLLAITTSIGALCLLYSLGELKDDPGVPSFQSAVYFLIAGLNGIVLAADLFNLFVFVELASVSAYILVAFIGGPEELEASLKYMILGTLTSLFFLMGVALIYDQAGSLNYGAVGQYISSAGQNVALDFGILAVMMGIIMPAAIFPLHTWLADAHSRAPTSVSALLSGASVQVGVFAVVRVAHQVVGLGSSDALQLLPWAGLATAVVGALLALNQTDLKRLLAYTTVSSGGFSVLLLSLGDAVSLRALFLHTINHASAKALLFLSAGCLIHYLSKRDYTEMGGAWDVAPWASLAFTMGAVADFGGPSLGFLSKGFMLLGIAKEGLLITVLASVAVVMVAVAYIRVIQALLSPGEQSVRTAVPRSMKVSTALLACACVGLAVASWGLVGAGDAVAEQLMDRLGLIAAMLAI